MSACSCQALFMLNSFPSSSKSLFNVALYVYTYTSHICQIVLLLHLQVFFKCLLEAAAIFCSHQIHPFKAKALVPFVNVLSLSLFLSFVFPLCKKNLIINKHTLLSLWKILLIFFVPSYLFCLHSKSMSAHTWGSWKSKCDMLTVYLFPKVTIKTQTL